MADEMEQWLSSLLRLIDEDEKMTERQIRIIQAAVDTFAEKGYASTSTAEIAQKAGVAEGTIFRHYKTKKDLLLSIVTPMMSKLVAPFVLRDFLKVLDTEYRHFEDFLRAAMRNRLEFVKKNAPIVKIMLHEIPFHPELRDKFKEELIPQVAERLRRIVTHFQARGEIVEMPPFAVVRMSVSAVLGYILTRCFLFPEYDWNDEEEIERVVRFIMHGLTPKSGAD
ncbi:TetR/AcrR family transcriptional regulator [Alicyclobacillus macrosporangiidus]|uniref:DNA-binding transcriptional regulator, AcrR family n=1 Tax=Alicyclobacillus macrosporangiidus TaxID=392015 RepID=A0A1I7L6I4_9BACL|nr:TetR/AcrR family transcriptional regulator [Alicyclobacillus macrosporangiidus]SFV05402.1 DNA-binding transcriptional regulator, AcrR family [Alicyclobacillus macrosporangiidus]